MPELDGPRWGPADKSRPAQLVVLCHGVGADGHDLIDLAPRWGIALPQAAYAAPDAPEPCDMGGTGFGRQWFAIGDRRPAILQAGAAAAAGVLDRFIDAELARLGLPPDAYALMGFSQGAMVALQCGLRRAVPPRAILAFSGALLQPAGITARPPVLLVHGEIDQVVPVERSRAAEAALQAAGIAVESAYRPALGHGIDEVGLTAGALFLQRAFAT
ncbi:MAG: prolyl oligopeptidase family serine peptidase [Rhodospirillales bacterium]|nr:prolyl oligopeptidase family serine peptidase [Rhodospirillales bacterium]MDE2574402.1 prolyl oligopeptidase family serine peptidase [Rhodospirillales bacterium]